MSVRDDVSAGRSPESPSHPLSCVAAGGAFRVELGSNNAVALDRDVVVRWPVATDRPSITVDSCGPRDGRLADAHALALQEKAAGKDVELLTDDYSVQNIARKAGLRIRALRQKKSRYGIVWEKRCVGCGRAYPEGGKASPDGDTCVVCGSPLRQKKRFATRSK
jgi:predicted nucleic acid-binding Zn ribbon protein